MRSRILGAAPAARFGTLLPGPFALLALIGAGVTLAQLISTQAVDIGAYRAESTDGLSLYLGHGLFHDPAGDGYTPLFYTPLLPAMVAGLDEIGRWNGWPVLVCVLATLVLAGLVAGCAIRHAGDLRPSTVVGAIGMGGLGVWLVTSVVGILYYGWSDELAWALALAGLLVGGRAAGRGAAAASVVLLSLAFWAKQTTLVAALAYAVWMVALTARGRRSIPETIGRLGALLALNLAALGLLALATGGWEPRFNFVLPARQARVYGLGQAGSDIAQVVLPPALWAGALCAAALGRRPAGQRGARIDGEAALLALFVVLGIPAAAYFRSKQGGNPNQYFGVVWAMAALAAIAWGSTRRCPVPGANRPSSARAAADGLIVVALLGAVLGTISGSRRFDLRALHLAYTHSVPADLRALASRGGLYSPAYSDLTPGVALPGIYSAADLLASGEQPMALVRSLVKRRFRYVQSFAAALGPGEPYFERYASTFGAGEANYLWKLDAVIAAGYAARAGLPPGVLERRPGPDRAAPLASCFGPFELARIRWTIRRGGGFWCRGATGRIRLAASPAPLSELVTSRSVRATGTLELTARPGAEVALLGASGWGIDARRRTRGWSVLVARPSGGVDVRRTVTAVLRLDLGGGSGLRVPRAPAPARLSILATPGRGVSALTGRLHLQPECVPEFRC